MKLIFFKILLFFCLNLQTKDVIQGRYEITTDVVGENNARPKKLTYYLTFKSQKMILSIKSNSVENFWCEGVYELKKKGDIYIGLGPCSDENHDNDIYVKKNESKIFIKSKVFVNKNWLELK